MGIAIDKDQFTPEEFRRFSHRLNDCLDALKKLLEDPGFGGNIQSWGAELELYLVDSDGKPVDCNQEIISAANNPLLTPELNRYNLEYNSEPVENSSSPLTELQRQLEAGLETVDSIASKFSARQCSIGILPTLGKDDFGTARMTDIPRYRALTNQLKRVGPGEFRIHINGEPPFQCSANDVTFEGANTSFQLHYRVSAQKFVDLYNGLLLATPVVMGISGNSPTLFGHRLWHETRIPLFKHSIDYRQTHTQWRQPSRVSFGHGFLRRSAFELFAETVALHLPLLPVSTDEDYAGQLKAGETPKLDELRLHQNSVWSWLRPVYDYHEGGHLRLELRALPAGPTTADMLANAAFYIGLGEGIAANIEDFLPGMTFNYAKYNFYRASQFGPDALLVWPRPSRHCLEEHNCTGLARELLPLARDGLELTGMDRQDIDCYLGIIEERIETCQTGSTWQLAQLEKLSGKWPAPTSALSEMFASYMEQQSGGRPVAQWESL